MSPLPSLHAMKYLFILYRPSFAASNTSGDSYSSIEYDVDGEPPNEKNPFGNPPYPGDTYAGGPNWVGYLATDYKYENSPLMVFDYAVCGHVVQRVQYQVTEKFLPKAGRKPEWAPWESDNSLFSCTIGSMTNCALVSWVGINDCGIGLDPRRQVEKLFEVQEMLYTADARNFLFFNVPPTDRSPAGNESTRLGTKIRTWNLALTEMADEFQRKHSDVKVKVYDAARLFNAVLDEPKKYGFRDSSTKFLMSNADEEECIWYDGLHPTSAMYKVLAADLAKFLTEE